MGWHNFVNLNPTEPNPRGYVIYFHILMKRSNRGETQEIEIHLKLRLLDRTPGKDGQNSAFIY